ncbi:hypothetical protein EX895_005466 [Sporisorium graminicola]|uniref:FAD/NAD(P)-binding domain-containing protein n=1 Tax=Sporisorium graminicola TaxID=280036 RepID=A0A4U7KMC5_9BASI|nr:hypothetical protein EX895_005466 [Sporisorium graminicola]TKY85304.1 hypothetical protein EX895_005466 [Sporisorium graminicola]
MTGQLKNVIIVGASCAGMTAAHELASRLPESYRLIVIEANHVAFWPIGGLRASVEPGFEDKTIADINPKQFGGEHITLTGTRVVELKPSSVIVDKVSGLGHKVDDEHEEISFEQIILALGSTYPFPCRLPSGNKADILAAFQKMQKEIEASHDILINGAGAVGVEFAGEVVERYGETKQITLVNRTDRIAVPKSQEAVSHRLKQQLAKHPNVTLILQDTLIEEVQTRKLPTTETLHTHGGKVIKADFTLQAIGNKPNSDLIKDDAVLDDKRLIRVNQFLQVTPADQSQTEFDWSRYYAIGDVSNFSARKTVVAAEPQAKAAAHNVLEAIKGSRNYKQGSQPPNVIVVPFGKSAGASYLMFFSLGEWVTSFIKGKTLFVDKFVKMFK